MPEFLTTRYHNVLGRAEYLRKNAAPAIVPEGQEFLFAMCEEFDHMEERLNQTDKIIRALARGEGIPLCPECEYPLPHHSHRCPNK